MVPEPAEGPSPPSPLRLVASPLILQVGVYFANLQKRLISSKVKYIFRKNEGYMAKKETTNIPQKVLKAFIKKNKELLETYGLKESYDFQDGGPKEAMQFVVIGSIYFGKPINKMVNVELWCDIANDTFTPRFCFSVDLCNCLNIDIIEYGYKHNLPFNFFDSKKWREPWNKKDLFKIPSKHKKCLILEYTGKYITNVPYGSVFIPSDNQYKNIVKGLNKSNAAKFLSYYFYEKDVKFAFKDFFKNILPGLSVGNSTNINKKYIPPETEIKKDIEDKAIEFATRYYEEKGFDVKSVEKENLGWDLTIKQAGIELHIEVKGTCRDDYHFFLSKQEYKEMKKPLSRWILFVVKNVLTNPTPEVIFGFDVEKYFDLEPFCWEGSWKK